ncbi:MAG TPA: NAD(P)-binding domain-containing protein [Pseudonocardiaceae bacterium]|nr:NAD(P)-binding domain-containing protein [Pseudonocardiaceae bacterium]
MRVAVIGSGRIGGGLARLLVRAGHTVFVANSRGPESLAGLVSLLGPSASARSAVDAARSAQVVVLAVPASVAGDLFPADAVTGKILVDATNQVRSGGSPTSSERLAARYPNASVVKSLNTMRHDVLVAAAGRTGQPPLAHFVASDDEDAKQTVASLVESLGFAVVDTGDLHTGSLLQQPGGLLFDIELTAEEATDRLAAAHVRN